MTIRTPFDPAAAAIFAVGPLEAPPAGHSAPIGSFAFEVSHGADDIRVSVLPGWPEVHREAPVRKPVPGRVYH